MGKKVKLGLGIENSRVVVLLNRIMKKKVKKSHGEPEI